jgi:hypothetical protein
MWRELFRLNASPRRVHEIDAATSTISQSAYLACVFAACSASVSHLSAISMKRDLCREVRAASANRMHSTALLRS